MAQVGEATIKLKLDSKGLTADTKSAEKEVEKSGKSLGEKLASGFKDASAKAAKAVGKTLVAGLTAAGAATIKIGKDAVEAFANYEQLVGGVDTLFKESSAKVQEYAQNAYKTAGLSANAYMEQATSFSARLIRDTGGDTEKVADLINMAITDMADNANKMGTNIESIQNAYEGLSKGNATMLDNLKVGYGGTQTEMLKLAKDMGVVGEEVKSFNDISFEQAILAIHEVQNRLDITGTTAKEATDTITGSFGSLKGSWENVLTAIGSGDENLFTQSLNGMVESAKNVLKNLIPVVMNVVKGLPQLLSELAPEIITVIEQDAPTIINDLVNTITQLMPTIINAVMSVLQAVINALMQPNVMSQLLNAAMSLFMQLVNALPQIVNMLVDALPTIIDTVINFLSDPNTIQTLVGAAVDLFFALIRAVPLILEGLLKAFGNLFNMLWEGVKTIFSRFVANFGDTIKALFTGALNIILQYLENVINGPIDLLNGFLDIINAVPGVNIGKIPRINLPRLASGGIVPATAGGQVIMAGEAGEDEWVVPESKMASLVRQIASTPVEESNGASTLGGVNIVMNNYINNDLDINDVNRKMINSIRMATL